MASHDGIGLRPTEGLLDDSDISLMVDTVLSRGGKVNYRTLSDGTKKPYEMNINYLDAVCEPDLSNEVKANKFMATQAILLSIVGVPGIYIHSMLGSRNDIEGMESSGINRRINREKLNVKVLEEALDDKTSLRAKVFERYMHLLNIRKDHSAFSPFASQSVIYKHKHIFSILRHNKETDEMIEVLINISSEKVQVIGSGYNLITDSKMPSTYLMEPYEILWCQLTR